MQTLQTEVLVIGGGATGTGVLRDLAMRGFKALLVEKADLATGTTGRYHGLLHSGGRYVVKDLQAARECIQENIVLRRIMPHCLEDTGGYFVLTPWDEPGYCEQFLSGCQQAGIPVEEVPVAKMLKEEPLLNPSILRCFQVPDAAADSFLAAQCNLASAQEYGAGCLTYHRVTGLLLQDGQVRGARLLDMVNGEEKVVLADFTVNATGAWVGQLCALAGLEVDIIAGKGSMLALNQRILHTVVNRCKLPSDGDILVPIHTVTVMGTTDIRVADPDRFSIEPWEVQLMLAEGEKLVPGFRSLRFLRAWAGVRPLFQEKSGEQTRDISRAFVLLDHQERDGLPGMVSITSGKWTTYRRMAEATVDLVCHKLGVSKPCRTHLEPLPDTRRRQARNTLAHRPARNAASGGRLAEVETNQSHGDLVCECELATVADVTEAILKNGARSIDDIRRLVRLGMGPCQGGFCTYRAAGLLHQVGRMEASGSNNALRDFLLERWKGLLPVLWGTQLRQERLDELIYLSLLNTDHLPGLSTTPFTPIPYAPLAGSSDWPTQPTGQRAALARSATNRKAGPAHTDVLVVGAGLSGLCAAWQATKKGLKVRLVSQGHGSLYFHTGCVDVLGYHPAAADQAYHSPRQGLHDLAVENPAHPYALAGLDRVSQALEAFKELCEQSGYPLVGSLDANWLLPAGTGSLRPTCLAPLTMTAGDASRTDPTWVVGLQGFQDFYPSWIASNLELQGIRAHGLTLDLPPLRKRKIIHSRLLADQFDRGELQEEIISAMRSFLSHASPFSPARLAFPAVLGLNFPLRVLEALQAELGMLVFEIPTLPPSIPGMRLADILQREVRRLGGLIHVGLEVADADYASDGRIIRLWSKSATRSLPLTAEKIILATGGILGGGFVSDSRGDLSERILGLPLDQPGRHVDWFSPDFFNPRGHPIFRAGVTVDRNLQPVDRFGQPLHPNLYAVGAALGGYDALLERSLEGVALVTGCLAGEIV